MIETKRPLLILESDSEFSQRLKLRLRLSPWAPLITGSPIEFIQFLKKVQPSLCIISVDDPLELEAYSLLRAIRRVKGNSLPVIVMSLDESRQRMAHAIETGASDYLPKSIGRETLLECLDRWGRGVSETVRANLKPVPSDYQPLRVGLALSVKEVSESGVQVVGPHLLHKGVLLTLKGGWVEELTGHPSVRMTVTHNWVDLESGSYGTSLEFEEPSDQLVSQLRTRLAFLAQPR